MRKTEPTAETDRMSSRDGARDARRHTGSPTTKTLLISGDSNVAQTVHPIHSGSQNSIAASATSARRTHVRYDVSPSGSCHPEGSTPRPVSKRPVSARVGLHATSDTVKLLVACQVVPLVLCIEFGPL